MIRLHTCIARTFSPVMKHEQRDWYDTPLYYDMVYGTETTVQADFMEAVFEQCASRRGRGARAVLEPACGSGRLIEELARRGWRASGFDANERQIEFARERLRKAKLSAKLWQARMEDFAVPAAATFDLIHCLVSTFKYLLTEAAARKFLRGCSDCLRPGGLFFLGVHLSDYDRETHEHERWVVEENGIRVVCNTRNWPADRRTRLEKARTRIEAAVNGETSRQEITWSFRAYDAAQLRRTIRAAAPQLHIVQCFDFSYDIEQPRELDDSQSDVLVVMRKR